jgi:hypothetical protein
MPAAVRQATLGFHAMEMAKAFTNWCHKNMSRQIRAAGQRAFCLGAFNHLSLAGGSIPWADIHPKSDCAAIAVSSDTEVNRKGVWPNAILLVCAGHRCTSDLMRTSPHINTRFSWFMRLTLALFSDRIGEATDLLHPTINFLANTQPL